MSLHRHDGNKLLFSTINSTIFSCLDDIDKKYEFTTSGEIYLYDFPTYRIENVQPLDPNVANWDNSNHSFKLSVK